MKPVDRRNIYFLIGIVFSLILILLAVTIATQRSSFFGRASGPAASGSPLLSLENSYLFASPITAQANGESSIRVTAFVMNSQGLGIVGQKVVLKYNGSLAVSEVQGVTDTFGRAIFDLTGNTPGSYTISGEVGGVSLPQTVSVSFR
ncbi:Ig-like domain-containing protein [Candidatus Gottesmanbacteria bacterium]|nr:Ig-like domain-containing protein [Candidatus Gottesmanbacteria bacterium]MBI5452157.1 Ig-like domain-containing protein [Candidatus Gottesmanbacteria bacterium]